jgi:hypothetical protein
VVEVRLRGSLSARRWSASCPVAAARLRFFLFFLVQQPNSKAVTSLSVENELFILLRSSCFLAFLVEAVPKVLDVPFPVSSTPCLFLSLLLLMTSSYRMAMRSCMMSCISSFLVLLGDGHQPSRLEQR